MPINKNINIETDVLKGSRLQKIIDIWQKIDKWVIEEIRTKLDEKKILNIKDTKFSLTPDFEDMESWIISTSCKKMYSSEKEKTFQEMIDEISGKLTVCKDSIPMGNSFKFQIVKKENLIFIDFNRVRRIIKEINDFNKRTNITAFGPELSKKLENIVRNITIAESTRKEIKDALKYLRFSEEESNAMILAAMEDTAFKDTLTSEEMLPLVLRQKQ
jgi:hypothetical protein